MALLERNRLADGSTAKAATLLPLARNKARLIPWVRETYELIDEVPGGDSAALGFARVGALHLVRGAEDVSVIDDTAAVSIANGVEAKEVDARANATY